MRKLTSYISEKLNADVEKWIDQVFKTQQTTIRNNKVVPIDVDVNKLNKPKNPFLYEEFATDEIVKNIIGHKLVGFTVFNQMMSNPNQYILDKNKKMQPSCLPYWYQDGDNVYFVGLCVYDKTVSYIEKCVHLIGIESSLIVAKSDVLNKAILMDFIKLANAKGAYVGITAKPTHPKMKANLLKLGFAPSKENKELLTYKL